MACVPRWCRDVGIETARACTMDDLEKGSGCPAGSTPRNDGACVVAGSFAGSGVAPSTNLEVATLAQPPKSGAPWPDQDKLPGPHDTFFCVDTTASDPSLTARFCTGDDRAICQRNAAGELPQDPRCLHAGVSWPGVCPPGFVVDASVPAPASALPACKPDPADCGTDHWGEPKLDDGPGRLFVSAEKGSDIGDGTRGKPFATVLQAAAKAKSGDTLSIAAGTYDLGFKISIPVTIRGRCAAMVHGRTKDTEIAFRVAGPFSGAVHIERVHLQGAGWGVAVTEHSDTHLDRLWLTDLKGIGVGTVVGKTKARLTNSVIDRMRLDDTGGGGVAVDALANGTIELQNVRIRKARSVALAARGGTIVAQNVLIDNVGANKSGMFGYGVAIEHGGAANLAGVRIDRARIFGVYAGGPGSTLTARGIAVAHTQQVADTVTAAAGIRVANHAEATIAGARIWANPQSGLSIYGPAAKATVRGAIFDDTRATIAGKQGRGVNASHSVELRLDNVRTTGNRGVGVAATGKGTKLVLRKVLIDGTLPREADKLFGWGLNVDQFAILDAEELRITGGHHAGLMIRNTSTATLRRVLVDNIGAGNAGKGAPVGLSVSTGARADLESVRVTRAIGTGLVVTDGGVVHGSGLLVDHTRAPPQAAEAGRGVIAQIGADIHLVGSAAIANLDGGVVAIGASNVKMTGVLVARTAVDTAGQYGTGFTCDVVKKVCTLSACRSVANRTAAVTVRKSRTTIHDSVLGATGPGKYPADKRAAGKGEFYSIADGFVASEAEVDVHNVLIAKNARTGVLLRDCPNSSVKHTFITGGAYGLAFAGHAPTIEQTLAVGTEQGVAAGTKMFIPLPPGTVDVSKAP